MGTCVHRYLGDRSLMINSIEKLLNKKPSCVIRVMRAQAKRYLA